MFRELDRGERPGGQRPRVHARRVRCRVTPLASRRERRTAGPATLGPLVPVARARRCNTVIRWRVPLTEATGWVPFRCGATARVRTHPQAPVSREVTRPLAATSPLARAV